MSSIARQFESLLGADAVLSWERLASPLQAQISQAAGTIDCVVYPATVAELTEVVAVAQANRWSLLPFGSGSKLHWGGRSNQIQVGVSTAQLDALIEHASGDLTVTVAAGLPFQSLQQQLATAGQFLPIDPAYADRATLGGIVATADTGRLRQRYGGIRDLLIGLSFVRSDGKIAKAGGRVVKNVAGYDLMKLLTGSYGTLGILTELTFRIYPLPPTSQTVILTGEPATIAQAAAALLKSGLTPHAMTVVTDPTLKALLAAETSSSEMGLLLRFQSIEVSVLQQIDQVLKLSQVLGLTAVQVADPSEVALWQQLQEQIHPPNRETEITCKIGVEPAQAVDVLNQLAALSPIVGEIQASSGLGMIRLPEVSIDLLQKMRQLCEAKGGFLTILAAPIQVKKTIDVWGYSGNALGIMRRLKSQFDPNALLSPHRFVSNI